MTPQWEKAFLDIDDNDYSVETGLFSWWKNISHYKAVTNLPRQNWGNYFCSADR